MDAKEVRERTVRDAKAGLILDAAMGVFARSGYYNTRLEDIAAEAGFSKAALYNYYPNKEAIFLHLAIREYDRLYETVAARIDLSAPLRRNVECVVRTILELCGEHFSLLLEISDLRCMNAGEVESLARQHAELFDELRARLAAMSAVLESFLAVSRERGELQSALSDTQLSSMIGAQIRGVLFEWKLAGSKGAIGTDVANVTEFVLCGLRACAQA